MRIDGLKKCWVTAAGCWMLLGALGASAAESKNGLIFQTKGADGKTDVQRVPNVFLYVPAGEAPTPMTAPGKFEATWEGFVSVDLRAEYAFQVQVGGQVKIEVNGAAVLEKTGEAKPGELPSAASSLVKLSKGTNAFKVSFVSPPSGDAVLRVFWSQRPPLFDPIPNESLTYGTGASLESSEKLAHGRSLFLEHRCAKCHTPGDVAKGALELSMDAPQFKGIGARRQSAWLEKWIADPKSMRSSTEMPKVFHGSKAPDQVKAVTAYLASLNEDAPAAVAAPAAEKVTVGKKLFETLHCVACHQPLEGEKAEPGKISLTQVKQQFSGTGALVDFLKQPSTHYAWIRMPNFKLSQDEAVSLAAYLETHPAQLPVLTSTVSKDAAVIEEGRNLVRSSGCLNCHGSPQESTLKTKALAELAAEQWKQGCLAEAPVEGSRAPHYQWTASDREALQLFAQSDRQSIQRHVPAEFAARQVAQLNCAQCHGQVEGFPRMEIIGGKLKPEWMKKFIAGETPYKPRPWMEHRMPGFGIRAEALAKGLAMSHGLPPQTPPDKPIVKEMADVGRKLVSSDGGFSCVSCHAVVDYGATQVFESAGINLAYSGERLQYDFYLRWIRNPLLIDPQTKMPVYFDEEGKSPLMDVLEGDGQKQMDAIWNYILLGPKMPPPGEVAQ